MRDKPRNKPRNRPSKWVVRPTVCQGMTNRIRRRFAVDSSLGMTRGRQSWQLIAELSILAVNCGTVTFFPTHKLLGRKKVKILPITIYYLRIFEARWRL